MSVEAAISDCPPTNLRLHRVLVVDDDELVQAGLRALLNGQPWVGQCFGASTLENALVASRVRQPTLALIELSVGSVPGLEISRALAATLPYMRIMLMSRNGWVSRNVVGANGGHGFILKTIGAAGVVEATRMLSQGRTVFSRAEETTADQLSPRELEVLANLVQGLSNPEIAQTLHLSRHTVKQHTRGVYKKLTVRNRAEAAAKARQLGLVG